MRVLRRPGSAHRPRYGGCRKLVASILGTPHSPQTMTQPGSLRMTGHPSDRDGAGWPQMLSSSSFAYSDQLYGQQFLGESRGGSSRSRNCCVTATGARCAVSQHSSSCDKTSAATGAVRAYPISSGGAPAGAGCPESRPPPSAMTAASLQLCLAALRGIAHRPGFTVLGYL
jgi:hypothetical protein